MATEIQIQFDALMESIAATRAEMNAVLSRRAEQSTETY